MTRKRKALIVVAATVGLLVAAFLVLSMDESPPDPGPLALARLDIPEAENAITYFDRAAAAIYWQLPPRAADSGKSLEEIADEPPPKTLDDMAEGDGWDAAVVGDVLERNKEVFALIEKGLARGQSQFPAMTYKNISYTVDPVLQCVGLSRLMVLRAESLSRAGRPREAFDQAVATAELGRRIMRAKGPMITFLVGRYVTTVGLTKVRQLICRDNLEADWLRPLIPRLAAYTDVTAGAEDALRAEYEFISEGMKDLRGTSNFLNSLRPITLTSSGQELAEKPTRFERVMRVGYFFKPNQTRRYFVESFSRRLRLISKPYLEVEKVQVGRGGSSQGAVAGWLKPNVIGRALFALVDPVSSGMHRLICQARTENAVTETLVALKCFKLKTGRLPQRLDELVPEYMPAVPLDDLDGKPIRYSAGKKIVYSVGEDFEDSGGMTREEARKWWAANKPEETLEEGTELDPWALPDASWPIEF